MGIRMPLKAVPDRHLRPVPEEGTSINDHILRENYERTLAVVGGYTEEARDLRVTRLTLEKLRRRALKCKAYERAAYLLTAIESIEEAARAK